MALEKPRPPYRESMVDQNGVLNRAWHRYFVQLEKYIDELEQRVETLEGP